MRFLGPGLPEDAPDPGAILTADDAARYLPQSAATLRTAAKLGYVRYEARGRGWYATLDEWRRGVQEYQRALRGGVPDHWISINAAAEHLGVSYTLAKTLFKMGLVRCKTVKLGRKRMRYAPPEEWEAALRRYRERVTPPKRRSKEERRQLARELGMPKPCVSKEEAKRRLDELTPDQRLNLRTLILAVMRGHPWPTRWQPVTVEQAETILGREVS